MTSRSAARLAWGLGAVCMVLVAASLVLLALDARAIDSLESARFGYFLQAPIVGILGVLIATRRPSNPIGWLLLAICCADAIYLFGDFVAIRGLLSGASPRSWVAWPAWVFDKTATLGVVWLVFVVLFFPSGRLLPGQRWRWAAWIAVAVVVVMTVSSMVALAPIKLSLRLPSVPNPLAVPALDRFTNMNGPFSLWPLLLLGLVLAAVAVRFRSAQGMERSQLRGFAYVAGGSLLLLVLSAVATPVGSVLATAGVLGLGLVLPATIGLAVMKYGLYDIDVFISRAVVYGSLAVFITAVYVGIAVGIGALVGSGGKPSLILSVLATAIVAIGFQPVRERMQKVANRLVYGKRATPYEVLSEFSGRVAETYAADEVLPRMARVLREGTGADVATVWLRGGAELRPAATFPGGMAAYESVPMSSGTLPTLPGTTWAVEVRHQGELLGALSVSKRRGEALTPIERKLVDDLAHQAGLVLKNVGLSADLEARLDELRASRQRLVSAQDLERRRLERNLHDGAQQQLVALKVKLGLAEMLLEHDPAKAAATLEQLKGDADEALETLRDLARGIYPPLLADRGLVVALESQAHKATVPVTVEAVGVQRYAQDAEATVYFCVLEALQNVQKYAAASQVIVRLRDNAGRLKFDVEDNGKGFDPAMVTKGSGLINMGDRVEALSGSVDIRSRPGAGTCIHGELSVQARAATTP